MSRFVRVASKALALFGVGCGAGAAAPSPAGQILLFIDTDAPLPAAPGSSGDVPAPALFDHLRVDVSRVDELAASGNAVAVERDFAVHRGLFAAGPISLGIAPPVNEAGYVAHVRLYRGADAEAGVPAPSSSIDTTLPLPLVAEAGVVRLLVTLHVDDTGVFRDEIPTKIAEAPTSTLVGTWPGAAPVPCAEAAGVNEACVPGGAFWMGDPQLHNETDVEDAEREHLVVVSPFFIDTHEVTVGELREALADLLAAGVALPPPWSGSYEGLDEDDYATFTFGPTDDDSADAQAAMPVNAVVWDTARAYCHARGKELPTEAMFEFLASGRGLEQNYVWGSDPPSCADVVAGRAGFGVYATFDGACRPSGSPGGAVPPGAGLRDRVELAAGDDAEPVVDLAGNLSEWMLDWFNGEDEGVWLTPGVLYDPVANERGGAGDLRAVRGGSWRGRYVELRAAARVGRDPEANNRSLGFRCARRPLLR
jgi:formylglycine-generating enzyme required for sulfatase activity